MTTLEQAAEKFAKLTGRLRQLRPGAFPLQDVGISPSLVVLLDYVADQPGCGIRQMALGLNLATPTVSISVQQLEKAGFLERQPDPQDGRTVQLFLSTTGQELHQRISHFRNEKFGRLLAGLTQQERNTLLELLEKALSAAEDQE